MRKLIAILASFALIAGLLAAPAAAQGKKKKREKVHESFVAQALPLVNLQATGTERRSCFAGVENVHWVGVEFESPGKGDLRLYMEGFTGDWDLAVVLEDGTIVYALGDQIGGAPPEEEIVMALKPKQKVELLACNYLGEPEVEVHYEGVFKK